jgi:pimeloyl-ACP methyl ester carboxylesterase
LGCFRIRIFLSTHVGTSFNVMHPFVRQMAIVALRFRINTTAFFSPLQAGKLALDIFRTPRKGRLREQDLTFLQGAEQVKIQVQGQDIQTYRWIGNGPTILMAHGWESNSARWRTFINLFRKKGYQVVALDAPGHGASSSDRFDAHIYGLAIQAVAEQHQPDFIVGHSAGGMALLYYLSFAQPAFVKGSVVVAAPSTLRMVLNNFCKIMGFNQQTVKGLDQAIKECFTLSTDDFSLFHFAKKTHCPGLLMFDTDDVIASYPDGQRMTEYWKNSQFKGYSGFGHSMNNKKVAEDMIEFFESIQK